MQFKFHHLNLCTDNLPRFTWLFPHRRHQGLHASLR